ncbi:MAG: DUF3108 domain-containing protein [Hydrogenophaga sp.]
MSATRTPAPAPRWPTLLALIAGVLGVHLALLVGELPGLPHAAQRAAPVAMPVPLQQTPGEVQPSAGAAQPAALARVSTVRWIVPAPAAEPATARPKPALPRKAPPAPPAAAQRAVQAEPPAVVADTAPDLAPPTSGPELPNADIPPAETVALAETTPTEPTPDPASSPVEATTDEPALAPDAELLAAAAVKKRAPPAATRALPPAQPPASTRLDYAVTGRIKGIAYNAEGQLNWTQADGRYSARMEMKVFLLGSRVQTSTGRVGPTGLSPERFADKSRSEKAAHFDAEQNRIRFSNNAPEAVLLPGAQDRLSLFLQIAGLLQARPQAYVSGQTIEMQVAGTGDADIWRFKVGEETTLALPAGELRVRQLVRLPRKEFDSTVEMWLAPDLQHLPVRLRVTQANGDVADQQLSRMP